MATMREVAELAGVSTATVSHVINGSKKLSPETTERVLQAIAQVNYTPNTLAKSLRIGQTHTIGILVEDIRGLPVAGIVSGISETLARSGYKTIFHDLHLLEKLYNQYEQIGTYRERINAGVALLKSSNVDGIIYVAMHDRHLDYLLDPMDTPLVYAYSHGCDQDTCFTYSNRDSAADMTRYLIARGHTRIAVIAGHPHSYPTGQRLLGIQTAMQQAGLALPADYIRYGDWEYATGKTCTDALLSLAVTPTAIFAMNDLMAAGSLATLQARGIRIPEDMAVVGFDNREIASYLQPPLTTIALPTTEIGTQAALHLMERINNPDLPPKKEIIHCSIIERASV
ncbi:MAG: LacI family DNA-binding transcriptional regulator [Clostridia bacterium]|nr:LacI family DNA-binding transcriptional regulator [Clostridia bacterium]MBR2287087.1 LacI family DNA-binding transcriptional regulator [Clostridia bacterium]